MKISFSKLELPSEGAVVIPVAKGAELCPQAEAFDASTGGTLRRAMEVAKFEGKKDSCLTILAPAGTKASRIVLAGLGDVDMIDQVAAQNWGGAAFHEAAKGDDPVTFLIEEGGPLGTAEFSAHAALGARLRSYRFTKYHTTDKKDKQPKKLTFSLEYFAAAKTAFGPLDKLADGVFLTRDVVSEPANVIYPETLAAECRKLEELGVEVEILGEKQMKKLGMGALLGVGQGSDRESFLVVMRWNGGKGSEDPIAFVGKGVCFDTGGISIKPAAGMEDMKWDMGGAGAVLGAMKALAGRKAKANVVGVVGLVENMPSGTAQRPGDVVTSMSGQTIEVINTDAEGRLVLADALWYTKEKFKPRYMIDLATLTGAIIVSLAHEHAGLFSNDDDLVAKINDAAKVTGESVWRFPMGEAYDAMIKSQIADMRNSCGREGGSITAAQFLKRFVGDTPWAHLDIAGMAWSSKDKPTCAKGATAFGVRLLDALVKAEEKA